MSMPVEQRQKCSLEKRIGPYTPGSMSGACYQDRRSGGCFETETRFEKEQADRKKQYEQYYSLMQHNLPDLPSYCAIGPNPQKSHGHELGPKVELTSTQIQSCIDAATPIVARKEEITANQEREQRAKYTKTAMDQLAKLPGASQFTTLAPCTAGADCSNDAFQRVWAPWIMAENGVGTKVDMKSIIEYKNGWTVIFTGVRGVTPVIQGLQRWAFDCAGHANDITGGNSPVIDVPPNSVLGRVSRIVCTTIGR